MDGCRGWLRFFRLVLKCICRSHVASGLPSGHLSIPLLATSLSLKTPSKASGRHRVNQSITSPHSVPALMSTGVRSPRPVRKLIGHHHQLSVFMPMAFLRQAPCASAATRVRYTNDCWIGWKAAHLYVALTHEIGASQRLPHGPMTLIGLHHLRSTASCWRRRGTC